VDRQISLQNGLIFHGCFKGPEFDHLVRTWVLRGIEHDPPPAADPREPADCAIVHADFDSRAGMHIRVTGASYFRGNMATVEGTRERKKTPENAHFLGQSRIFPRRRVDECLRH